MCVSLIIAIKRKAKCRFRVAAMLLYNIRYNMRRLQSTLVTYCTKICYHTALSGASVAPTFEVRIDAILVLWMVENKYMAGRWVIY